MSEPAITRMLAKLPGIVSLKGIALRRDDIKAVDVCVLRTLHAYQATEIKHDLELFRKQNMASYRKLKGSSNMYHPPIEDVATPIYLITRVHKDSGELVYVGKAQSTTNRFAGGHIAFLKLLDPKYQKYDKFISFAVINVRTSGNGFVPVEWIADKELRKDIVENVEHSLVWKFQPVYNTHYKSEEPHAFAFEMNLHDYDGSHINLVSVRIRKADAPIHQHTLGLQRSTG